MTHTLITTCCKEKDKAPGLLPAHRRYRSRRIQQVYQTSQEQGQPMLILSGKFGQLKPNEAIPWYDHPLKMEEVTHLIPKIITILKAEDVTQVSFICRPYQTPGWAPYHETLSAACQALNIPLRQVLWEDQSMDNKTS